MELKSSLSQSNAKNALNNTANRSQTDPMLAADAVVVLGIGPKKKATIKKSKIRVIARGLAEIAYSMGETNDQEAFLEEMTTTIMASFQQVAEEQKA